MNQLQYKSMISMLISVTKEKKLEWTETGGDYTTMVGGCKIQLCNFYDYNVNLTTYTLRLYNDEEKMFESISFTEDDNTDEYQQLNILYASIRDVIYKISESEKKIIEGLKALNKNNYNDLPF